MTQAAVLDRLPGPLRRHVLHFESVIEERTRAFADSLAEGARLLDAGAGECQYAHLFHRQRYVSVDLGIGDANWNYRRLDCIADLAALPVGDQTMDACINIVTLEHVREPARVIGELARSLRPGGRLLLVVPMEWEVHQSPHDFFRYTSHGVRHLLEGAGFEEIRIEPVGGYFRLLARRLLNGLQFFRGPAWVLAAAVAAPPALILPFLDGLDRERNFTLGYACTAVRAAALP